MRQRIRSLILLGAILVLAPQLLVRSLPAGSASGCLSDCETSLCSDFGNHTSFCEETRARCEAHCRQPDAYQAWGAIAYSKSDKGFGSAYNFDTKSEATKKAMENCSAHGNDCAVWIYFNKECGAIAVDGKFTGWGTANARYYANERAMKECASNGGRNCTVLDSVCSQ